MTTIFKKKKEIILNFLKYNICNYIFKKSLSVKRYIEIVIDRFICCLGFPSREAELVIIVAWCLRT